MPVFWSFQMALVLLAGCSQQPNYAPVIINNQAAVADAGEPVQPKKTVIANNNAIKEKRIEIPYDSKDKINSRKYYLVKNGDTLYSIGISSGYGHKRLAQWNQLTAPYQVVPGQQLKLFKPAADDKIIHKNHIPIAIREKNDQLKKPARSLNSKIKPMDKPVLSKQKPEIPDSTIAFKQEKKSIISTDNKKMLKLNFVWPIKGRVSRNFTQSNKKGIDIAGKMGQNVRAAEAGTIAYSGQGLIGFGKLIIIKHNDLYLSAYANNSHLLVKEGELVEKGQVIAQVGRALSKKAALHFEIRKNGKPVNPLILLPKNDKTF